jgi:hypothetical protein
MLGLIKSIEGKLSKISIRLPKPDGGTDSNSASDSPDSISDCDDNLNLDEIPNCYDKYDKINDEEYTDFDYSGESGKILNEGTSEHLLSTFSTITTMLSLLKRGTNFIELDMDQVDQKKHQK